MTAYPELRLLYIASAKPGNGNSHPVETGCLLSLIAASLVLPLLPPKIFQF